MLRLMVQALASPGAGHRTLIVLGIIGGIIVLSFLVLVAIEARNHRGEKTDQTAWFFAYMFGGFALAAFGYIIGIQSITIAGLIMGSICGSIFGLMVYNTHHQKGKTDK
jgi:NhaP-type Na+/H+ or K+/H+ antiporter